MSERILARFATVTDARVAAGELARSGFTESGMTMISDQPVECEGAPLRATGRSWIGLFAVAGGIIGAAAAVILTSMTSLRVNLITGGMPIIAPWTFGIIVFELTALGAILATLARTIYEAGLLRRGSLGQADSSMAEGGVILAVECPSEPRARAATRFCQGRGGEII